MMKGSISTMLCTTKTSIGKQYTYFFFFTVLLLNVNVSHQFASMLVDREVACYAVIRDPEEIIMNYPIKLVEKSAYPNDVYIEVLDIQNQQPVEVNVVDGRRLVYVEETSKNEKYILRLITHPSLKDLQYVMDVMVLPELDEDEDEKKADNDRMQGKFNGVTTGCNDSRAHGRAFNDVGLELEINIPSSLFSVKGGVENSVEVVAVWACGHEAITLTYPIFFLPKRNSINIDVDTQHGIDASAEIGIAAIPGEAVQDVIVVAEEEKEIKDEENMPATIERLSEGIIETKLEAGSTSQHTVVQNEPEDEQKQTNHHIEEEIENNTLVEIDPITAVDALQETVIQNKTDNQQKQTNHHIEEEIENNSTEEMDAIIEGLNKVEQVIENNSPEKIDAIMEGLTKVEELIQNNGVDEMDAIIDWLNKVEDMIKNDSPEEMDVINQGLNIESMDIISGTKNNLRRKIGSNKTSGTMPDAPTNQHEHVKAPKPKHKKHHRPDPLDTPIRRFRKKYDEEDFGMGSFEIKSYLLGLCVFVSGNFALFPFLFAIKRKYGKGRLD